MVRTDLMMIAMRRSIHPEDGQCHSAASALWCEVTKSGGSKRLYIAGVIANFVVESSITDQLVWTFEGSMSRQHRQATVLPAYL